jgi:hypothetical protein
VVVGTAAHACELNQLSLHRDEVSTACASGRVSHSNSIPVLEYYTHPLTQVVLTTLRRCNKSTAKAPRLENYFFPDFNSASFALNCGKS